MQSQTYSYDILRGREYLERSVTDKLGEEADGGRFKIACRKTAGNPIGSGRASKP